jgi:hypothetical protein
MNEIALIIITSIATSGFSYFFQLMKESDNKVRGLRRDRLTKLLLPLYMRMQEEGPDMKAELSHDNGDPGGFIDSLPKYYSPLIDIIRENIYLADDELTEKALKFIEWVRTEEYRESRYSEVMMGHISDVELQELRQCVEKKYQEEKKFLFMRW